MSGIVCMLSTAFLNIAGNTQCRLRSNRSTLKPFYYFTWMTRYLLVDQNKSGLVMRSTYCLLASFCNV